MSILYCLLLWKCTRMGFPVVSEFVNFSTERFAKIIELKWRIQEKKNRQVSDNPVLNIGG